MSSNTVYIDGQQVDNAAKIQINGRFYVAQQRQNRRAINGKHYGIKHMVNATVTYGFDVNFGKRNNQSPHFAMTIEVIDPKSRRSDNFLSGGADHETIKRLWPNIGKYENWHLASLPGEPMHYIANALYWLELACGISEWEQKPHDPEPLQTFKNRINYDENSDDVSELESILAAYKDDWQSPLTKKLLRGSVKESATRWLKARAERMQERFIADMVELGVLVPVTASSVELLRDGKLIAICKNDLYAMAELHKRTSGSAHHALQYEGWEIRPIREE